MYSTKFANVFMCAWPIQFEVDSNNLGKWIGSIRIQSGLVHCASSVDVTNAYSVSSVDRPKEIRDMVELSTDGSGPEPSFFSSDFHLVYQVWISLLREEIFGRSPEYALPLSILYHKLLIFY